MIRDPATPHRGGRAAAAALLAIAPRAAGAAAPEATAEPPPATFAVRFAADGIPEWQADAVARTAALDLAGEKLRPVDDTIPPDCPESDAACEIAAYRAAGVEIALLGRLGEGRLDYEILLTWPGASPPLRAGVARFADRESLVEALRAALRPITRPGGALEDRDSQARAVRPATLAAPTAGIALAALAAGIFLLLPLAFGAVGPGRIRLGQLVRTRALRRTLLALALLAAAATGFDTGVREWTWAVFLAGGLAWGALAAGMLPILFPPLVGLGRVEPAELVRVLRAWSRLALRRAVLVALLSAPVALAVWGASAALELPLLVALGALAPLLGLALALWLRSLVEVVSLRLDTYLIDVEGGSIDDWDAAIRAYYLGYVRRAGGPLTERLPPLRFLPGRGSEVHLYGGGFTPTRLVVGRELLEMALAPAGRPHDYALPRVSKLHWTEWNAGLIIPTRRDLPVATPEERQPTQTTVEGEIEHQPLGEPPTLAGLIEPSSLDRRDAHRPHEDLDRLDWDPGEQHDGTDAGDKDFLFGLLVHEVGRALRHEDRASTLAIAWRRWLARRPARLRRLATLFPTVASPAIADAHAALNFARHHLVQYLAYRMWRRDELLTARAYAPELERLSAEIVRALDGGAPDAALRRRLVWMAGFVHPPSIALRRAAHRWRRRAALAAVALAAMAAVASAVKRSIDYHPIYLERMNDGKVPGR